MSHLRALAQFCKAAYALFAECRSPVLPRPVLLGPDLECVLTTKNRSVDTPEERAQIAHRILAHSGQRHVYFSHFILECLVRRRSCAPPSGK